MVHTKNCPICTKSVPYDTYICEFCKFAFYGQVGKKSWSKYLGTGKGGRRKERQNQTSCREKNRRKNVPTKRNNPIIKYI